MKFTLSTINDNGKTDIKHMKRLFRELNKDEYNFVTVRLRPHTINTTDIIVTANDYEFFASVCASLAFDDLEVSKMLFSLILKAIKSGETNVLYPLSSNKGAVYIRVNDFDLFDTWIINPIDIYVSRTVQQKTSRFIFNRYTKSKERDLIISVYYDYENRDFKIKELFRRDRFKTSVEDIFGSRESLYAFCLMHNSMPAKQYTIEHDHKTFEFVINYHGIIDPDDADNIYQNYVEANVDVEK